MGERVTAGESTTVSLRRAPLSMIKERIEGVSGLHIDQDEVRHIKKFLWPEEVVELTIKQRKFRPGGSLITPTTFVATNKRLIILNRTRLGIRKNYEVIPYRYITAVKMEHGLWSCSVIIRVSSVESADTGHQGEVIGGIRWREAETLVHYLNKRIMHSHSESEAGHAAPKSQPAPDTKFCTDCGAKNPAQAKFCSSCGIQMTSIAYIG